MGNDFLSKEDAGELLDQKVHVLTLTQELRYLTRNYVKLAGDYLGEESLICLSMGTWLHHIERFKRQYNKAFASESYLQGGFDGSYPQTCSGVFTLLQHDCHKVHVVGGLRGVWGAS